MKVVKLNFVRALARLKRRRETFFERCKLLTKCICLAGTFQRVQRMRNSHIFCMFSIIKLQNHTHTKWLWIIGLHSEVEKMPFLRLLTTKKVQNVHNFKCALLPKQVYNYVGKNLRGKTHKQNNNEIYALNNSGNSIKNNNNNLNAF